MPVLFVRRDMTLNAMNLTFDTHAEVEDLIKGGLSKQMAEAVVRLAAKTTVMPDVTTLTTKDSIEALDKRMTMLTSFVIGFAGLNLMGFLGIAALIANILRA